MSDDIAEIFAAVARDIHPELGGVLRDAERIGRRMRARRRVVAGLAAVVCAAAVAAAVGTVLGLPGLRTISGPRSHSVPAAGGDNRSPSKVRASQRPPQAHGPGMTSKQLLAVLRPMLPPGRVVYVYKHSGRGMLEINFDDNKGAVDIMLDVESSPWPTAASNPTATPGQLAQLRRDWWDALRCPRPLWSDEGTRPTGAPPISCATNRLPDKSIVRTAVMYADVAGYYGYGLYLQRPDGIRVFMQVSNGTLGGSPHLARAGWPWVSRAVPPGSMELWRSVVESPELHL